MIAIFDNLLSKKNCADLVGLYHKHEPQGHEWRGTRPLSLSFVPEAEEFISRILKTVGPAFCAQYDWGEIVKWASGTSQPYHLDTASNKTIVTSITYLNEDFEGGYTLFEDGTKIKPVTGRCLVFNGQKYVHGVSEVTNGVRWTLPIWYKE